MLLSTVFLHMLPEVRDSIKKAVEKRLLLENADEKYHLGELLICTGWCFINSMFVLTAKFVNRFPSYPRSRKHRT